MTVSNFASRVIDWFHQHGRKDLPWQQNANPYRVWISEIMLQQTRVSAVIPFYLKFMERFPDCETLAHAAEDEVMHHWSGLGYYARARNLHKAAKLILADFAGEVPSQLEALEFLPGIGRSTAGAILSLGHRTFGVILDGNVKRVLCRHSEIEGWPGEPKVMQQLWQIASENTPAQGFEFYNQAMMDLGATCCSRSKPLCHQCPLSDDCGAYLAGRVNQIPFPKPKKQLPVKKANLLLICNQEGQVLLEKRPPTGIWGGLWCFPQTDQIEAWLSAEGFLSRVQAQENWPSFRHTFSHFHLEIQPILVQLQSPGVAVDINPIRERTDYTWHRPGEERALGFAAPVQLLLKQLMKHREAESLEFCLE